MQHGPCVRDLDPFRFGLRPLPEPVEGPLPPALCLVEEDGPFASNTPAWRRWLAAGMVAAFLTGTALCAGAALQVAPAETPED